MPLVINAACTWLITFRLMYTQGKFFKSVLLGLLCAVVTFQLPMDTSMYLFM